MSRTTSHRSLASFAVELLAGLIAYIYQDKKPSPPMPTELEQLPALL